MTCSPLLFSSITNNLQTKTVSVLIWSKSSQLKLFPRLGLRLKVIIRQRAVLGDCSALFIQYSFLQIGPRVAAGVGKNVTVGVKNWLQSVANARRVRRHVKESRDFRSLLARRPFSTRWVGINQTEDFSSQTRSDLRGSYITAELWSPAASHRRPSHRGADERGRRPPPFQRANFNTSANRLQERRCSPRCERPSALCEPGRSSTSSRGFTDAGRQVEEDFPGSPTGCRTHRTQCCFSVLVAPCTPLTPASC